LIGLGSPAFNALRPDDQRDLRRRIAAELAKPGLRYGLDFAGNSLEYTRILRQLNPKISRKYLETFVRDLKDCPNVSYNPGNDEHMEAIANNEFSLGFASRQFFVKIIESDTDPKIIESITIESSNHEDDKGGSTKIKLPVENWNTRFILDKIKIQPFLI
jgi:hypothetical protein